MSRRRNQFSLPSPGFPRVSGDEPNMPPFYSVGYIVFPA